METETPEQAEKMECHLCGDSHGPRLLTDAGWLCLRHLPKLGSDRRMAGRAASLCRR